MTFTRRCSPAWRRRGSSSFGPTRPRPTRRPRGPGHRHHRHGERQVAGVQPAGAPDARAGPARAGAVPVPDQGPRPGPGAQAERAAHAVPAPRDLRRRHAARGAAGDPPALESDPHQPGHAPRGRAAQPPPLGRRAGQPGLDRGGRGARLPRRVRLPRGQRAAPPEAHGAGLRHRAAHDAHQRDDRQPGGPGAAAHRPGAPAGGQRRRAAPRPQDRDVEPAAARREAGHARLVDGRGRRAAERAGRAGGADDLLHEVPPWRGAGPALHAAAAGGRRPRRPGRADRPLPRRLHRRPSGARSSTG